MTSAVSPGWREGTSSPHGVPMHLPGYFSAGLGIGEGRQSFQSVPEAPLWRRVRECVNEESALCGGGGGGGGGRGGQIWTAARGVEWDLTATSFLAALFSVLGKGIL